MSPRLLSATLALAALICIGTIPLSAEWLEGHQNRALNPGPWREGYIPTPPPDASYRQNAASVEAISAASTVGAFLVWVWRVQSGGMWDYKTQMTSVDEFRRLEAAGNFNYGVTAAALGIPYEVAQFLAGVEHMYGIVQRNLGFNRLYGGEFALGPYGLRMEPIILNWVSPFGGSPSAYYDDFSDAVSIRAGYDWYLRTQRVSRSIQENRARPIDQYSFAPPATRIESRFERPLWDLTTDRSGKARGVNFDKTNPFENPRTAEKPQRERAEAKEKERAREKQKEKEKEVNTADKPERGPAMPPQR